MDAADRKDTQLISKWARTSDDDSSTPTKNWHVLPPAARRFAGACATVAALLSLGYTLVETTRRVSDEPRDPALVGFAYAALAGLVWCIRREERLPASAAGRGERRLLQIAGWVLPTALLCAVVYRLSVGMPVWLVAYAWCIAAFVALFGLWMVVVRKDKEYLALSDGEGDVGEGNGKASVNMSLGVEHGLQRS